MSRAAAASQAGRPGGYPDNAAAGSRPHPAGRGSPATPSVVRQPPGAPGACGACAALAAALDPYGQALAAAMIENSDNAAASALWDTTGGLRPLITQRGDSRRPL